MENKPGIEGESFKVVISKDMFNIYNGIRKDFEMSLLWGEDYKNKIGKAIREGWANMKKVETPLYEMKENNTLYYTPDIEDIRVGYEYEAYSEGVDEISVEDIAGWYKYKWDQGNCWRDTVDMSIGIAKKIIRTPYLTKEQIEAEGFIDQQDRSMEENSGCLFIGKNKNIRYWFTTKRLSINGMGGIFDGKCKSINEFRTICKLLGI